MTGAQLRQLVLVLVVLAAAIALVASLLNWLYLRSSKERAFVRTGLGGQKVVPEPTGVSARPRGLLEGPAVARLVVPRRLREQLVDRPRPAQDEHVIGVPFLPRVPVGPLLAGCSQPFLPGRHRRRVGGRGAAPERGRLAHPAVVEVDHRPEALQCSAGLEHG